MFKIRKVNTSNFKDIPSPCNCCLYWQTSGPSNKQKSEIEMERKKREWFTKVNREFGGCGFVAYLNEVPIGFIQYAPPEFFPRVNDYDSGPPSEDSIFLACLYIPDKEKRGKGFGTAMLNHLVTKLKEREIKAVETFARKDSENNPSGPLKLYLKYHFKVKRDKDDFPLVRLEL